jgi:hypothetical protein
MSAFRFLKGHPLAMQAYFEQVLVLTYALPERSCDRYCCARLTRCTPPPTSLGVLAVGGRSLFTGTFTPRHWF